MSRLARPSEMEATEYARMADVEDDHWWYRTLRRHVLAALDRERVPGGRLLDVGCGTGAGLVAWGCRIASTGMDSSPEALDRCVVRGARRLVRGVIEEVPFRERVFDVVVSLDVICLTGIDEGRALSELFRVLRPGGVLVLNLPASRALRGQHDLAVRVGRRYERGEVVAMLGRAGFEVRRAAYWNTFLYPVAVAVRRLRRARAGAAASSDLAPLPGNLNIALSWLLRAEAAILRGRAPFGTSVLAVGRRPTG